MIKMTQRFLINLLSFNLPILDKTMFIIIRIVKSITAIRFRLTLKRTCVTNILDHYVFPRQRVPDVSFCKIFHPIAQLKS